MPTYRFPSPTDRPSDLDSRSPHTPAPDRPDQTVEDEPVRLVAPAVVAEHHRTPVAASDRPAPVAALERPSRDVAERRPASAYRAVVFDFFGTLTRATRRGQHHATVAALLGCPLEALVTILDRSFYLRATGALGDATTTLRWVCEQVGARPSAANLRAAAAARVAAVRADTRLRPEAVTVLRAVRRRGARTALISDCTHELPAFLPHLPVAPLLDVRVFSVQVGCCKPEPAIYLAACRRLGVAPADCLYVGDGGSQELTGAARTGMTAIRLAAADLDGHLVFNHDDGWTGPALTSLAELPGLLDAPRQGPAGSGPAATAPDPGGAGCGM